MGYLYIQGTASNKADTCYSILILFISQSEVKDITAKTIEKDDKIANIFNL
jgi:hypothetical protein